MLDFFSQKNKKLFIYVFISITCIASLYILFTTNIIHKHFVGGPIENFIDWKLNIQWLECNFYGEDHESCKFDSNYGNIFFVIPFNENLKIFYLKYLPSIFICLFVIIIVFLIQPDNLKKLIIVVLCIFNPTTLLLLERLNFDIVLFFILIFLTYNRIFFINWFLFCFTFLTKVFAITYGLIILIENKSRTFYRLIQILLFNFAIIFFYLIFNYQDFLNTNFRMGAAGYHFLFSLNSIPKLLKYSFNLNYIFSLVLVYSLFLYSVFLNHRFIKNSSLLKNVEIYSYNGKLFVLSVNTILLCFLTYSNYYYREVFLICAIPLLLELNKDYFKFFINFIILRYIFLIFYSFLNVNEISIYGNTTYHVDGIRYFKTTFLFSSYIKGFLDFALMSILSSIVLYLNLNIINNWKSKLFSSKIN